MASFILLAITGFLLHKFTTASCSSTVVNRKQLVRRRLMDVDARLRYILDKYTKCVEAEVNIF